MRATAAFILMLTISMAHADSTATADAERWMALVDAGKYAESWSAAGTLFQKGVTKEAWTSAASAAREPLGAVVTRNVLKEQPSTTLPGVPDGNYDVIQFTTEFAHKKAAIETAVLVQEDGSWKVVGYFVK